MVMCGCNYWRLSISYVLVNETYEFVTGWDAPISRQISLLLNFQYHVFGRFIYICGRIVLSNIVKRLNKNGIPVSKDRYNPPRFIRHVLKVQWSQIQWSHCPTLCHVRCPPGVDDLWWCVKLKYYIQLRHWLSALRENIFLIFVFWIRFVWILNYKIYMKMSHAIQPISEACVIFTYICPYLNRFLPKEFSCHIDN